MCMEGFVSTNIAWQACARSRAYCTHKQSFRRFRLFVPICSLAAEFVCVFMFIRVKRVHRQKRLTCSEDRSFQIMFAIATAADDA